MSSPHLSRHSCSQPATYPTHLPPSYLLLRLLLPGGDVEARKVQRANHVVVSRRQAHLCQGRLKTPAAHSFKP